MGLHVEALNPQGNRNASCKIQQTKLQINTDDCLSAVPPGFLLTSPLLSASFDLRRKKKRNHSCVSTDVMGNIANRPAELAKHCQSAGLPSDWPPVPRPPRPPSLTCHPAFQLKRGRPWRSEVFAERLLDARRSVWRSSLTFSSCYREEEK